MWLMNILDIKTQVLSTLDVSSLVVLLSSQLLPGRQQMFKNNAWPLRALFIVYL